MDHNKVIFTNGYREALSKKTSEPDIIKVFAVLSVMWQGILGLMMKQKLDVGQQVESVILLDFLKYSAPFFIFAICFDICKIKNVSYKTHVTHKFKELLIPYFCWATVYILMNRSDYKSTGSVVEGYLLGTNAPHTWYLVMMFQFHLLVPVLWYLYAKFTTDKKKVYPVLIGTFLFYLAFVCYYHNCIFNVTTNKALLYLDRSFIGFSIYAVLGVVASAHYEKWNQFVSKTKLIAIPLLFIVFNIANQEVFSYGFDHLSLANAIYLKPSTFFYNIFAIIIIYGLSLMLIKGNSRLLPALRFLAQYAYRAYLANFFVITMLVKAMGKSGDMMPYSLRITLLWIMTAIFSFSIVYAIEYILKYLPKNIMESKKKTQSSNVITD
ncbi:acyltransferase family protein [Anaeromicropila herbilytica]|uniref:Membrane protein n=1 Tax=Anaeromicropila herbilytica TaxID=2785025 RepID=A0A7R7IF27_9FIRM|nr:acyltransferase [Anaeromicropila herbilytica]BCN32661.1 membrane protein [Anaeromicropila herbilytica]